MARVSIKDIAEKLGVSSATVSLVLNEKDKDSRIGKEVAEKVRKAAIEMNYRPNMAARSLRTGKTKTLGLIVADISNPFFAKLARHIENIAADKGYQVMFGSSDESSIKFEKLTHLFIEKNVDGIIVVPPQDSEGSIMELVKRKVPLVLVDRGIEGLPVSSIQIDNVGASFELTNILLDRGCKRIGFMAYNINLPNIKKRYEGYEKALKMRGLPIDSNLVCSVSFENFEENVKRAIKTLIDNDIDSVVFATNRVGVQSLIALQDYVDYKKLKYVSIDNPDEYIFADIDITCIAQPVKELGERTLDILFKYIENPKYRVVEYVTLQANIVIPGKE
ncbi:LacI family DNA-binding transcriptional regulator [Prevotella sp. 10(H)]|uniref:LacI family DNA-binding transcriptional regulator n=1 Tax=Prevotella sp. 10(H) TaxID=1158294 RepID=UPI0004A786CF|nr:LacI family DNA-binding transcriptional regulator [Prevotella sp. 10(H)]